ncbi:MAG: hypothetical protein AAF960_10540 [Bacteroidota bacterium]
MTSDSPNIQTNRDAVRTFFQTDRGILLISMGISLLFWLLVKLSQEHKSDREIAITYTLPEGMAFINIPPDQINVTLTGRGWDLMYDFFGQPTNPIEFALTDTPIQTIAANQLRSKLTDYFTSSNISIEEMSFDYISIQLGQKAQKTIPIILNDSLTFAPNYQLKGAVQLTPDSITLHGPQALLEEYTAWPTAPLIVTNLQSSLRQSLPLTPNNQPPIVLSTDIIDVLIPVEQFTEKSLFIPVQVKNAPDSLKVFPNMVKTSFVVGLSQYDTISVEDFQLEVDLKNIPINQANNTAPILLTKRPTVVKNVRFSPKAVQFLFIKEERSQTLN